MTTAHDTLRDAARREVAEHAHPNAGTTAIWQARITPLMAARHAARKQDEKPDAA